MAVIELYNTKDGRSPVTAWLQSDGTWEVSYFKPFTKQGNITTLTLKTEEEVIDLAVKAIKDRKLKGYVLRRIPN